MWVSFYLWVPASSVNGCSTASCNFGALSGRDEHRYFYSAVLNQRSFFFLSFEHFLIEKHNVRLSSLLFIHVFITYLSRGYRKSCTIFGMRNTAVDKFSQSSHSNLVLFLSFWFTDVFPENGNGVKKDKRQHSTLGFYQIEEGLAQGQGLWIYCSLLTHGVAKSRTWLNDWTELNWTH